MNPERLSPRSAALAYRIWAYCEPKGWDLTILEAADALDVKWQSLARVVGLKGWQSRFRASAGSRDMIDLMHNRSETHIAVSEALQLLDIKERDQ